MTLTSKDLPVGKVGTVYSEDQYFTATVEPSSATSADGQADLTWEVDGLPAGLSFDKGKISGTPTESGDFSVKVTVTATLTNYNPTSTDITALLTIESADEQSSGSTDDGSGSVGSGDEGGSESSSDDVTQVTDSNLQSMSPEAKAQVKSITFSDLSNLQYLIEHLSEFTSLTTVTISSDVDISNFDFNSLPEGIPAVSISGNTSIKSLNLKECKVPNIDASNCADLTSVDVSGNPYIKSLNVSQTGISTLNASYCTKLESVDCSGGVLSGLNVEGSTALKSVNCGGNSLLALDIPSELTNLTSVDCTGQALNNWSPSLSFNFEKFVQSPDTVSASSLPQAGRQVRVSATKLTNVANLKAYDINGNGIAVTSDDNGNITFASEPYTMTYDYDIGDINNTLMDVTVISGSGGNGGNSNDTLSSSGGGCNVMKNEGLILILLLFELALSKLKVTRR